MEHQKELARQRRVLLQRLDRLLEGPMALLGFVWLALLMVELIRGLTPALEVLSLAIWVVFLFDFGIKLLLAPGKIDFLKKNWLTVLSLLVPALRVVRFARLFRAVRGLRSVRLVKVVGSLNRGMKSLGATMQRRGLKYVLLLTGVVIFAGAAGMYAFEKAHGLPHYGAALWWTAMLITSIGSEYWPQTGEGKALCLLLSVYGFCVFGYITATLASFFVGRDAEEAAAPVAGSKDLARLSEEVRQLSQAIRDLQAAAPGKNGPGTP